MGQFRIEITAVGKHGCDRSAQPGGRLHERCGRLTCPDCLALDFVQALRQKGVLIVEASFTHFTGSNQEVVDDLLENVRTSGNF